MNRYVLRFDDVAPGMAWSRFLPLKAELETLAVPVLLGVVPENRDPTLEVEPVRADFFERVRTWQARGDAIAQHGTYHVYDTGEAGLLGINPRSEFAGHPLALQRERLAEGKRLLEAEGVWQPWFMAPSHSFDDATLAALRGLGFRALSDGYGFHTHARGGLYLVPSLTARPLRPVPGICTICIHVNTLEPAGSARLLAFVRAHAERFVPFGDALDITAPSAVLGAAGRGATRLALGALRRSRRAAV